MKGQVFCPRCGKTDDLLSNGLCRPCFLKEFRLINIPDEVSLTICTQCGSVQKKGRWFDSDLSVEDQAIDVILEHIIPSEKVEKLSITPQLQNIRGSKIEFLITAVGKVLGEEISQEYLVQVEVNKNVCSECSKYASGYYEAVIQLRANNRTITTSEIQSADEIVKNRLEKLSHQNRMAYIAQRAEIKEGVDYYIGSLKAARKLTDSLKNRLGGVINESPRLMGHDKSAGKDLYRVWILLRIPEFKKGDFVEYNKTISQITGYDGSKIYLVGLKTSQQHSIPWKTSEDLRIVARERDIQKAMVSSKTPDTVQILHPETYQPLDLPLSPEFSGVQIGEELEVIEIKGKFYILR